MNGKTTSDAKGLLKEGIILFHENWQAISAEWERLLAALQTNQARSAPLLRILLEVLYDCVAVSRHPDELLSLLQVKRETVLGSKKDHPQMLVLMSMLENAAHKAVQKETGGSFRPHQSLQYLFLQITEKLFAPESTAGAGKETRYFEQCCQSEQLPIYWIAICKPKNGYYQTEMIFPLSLGEQLQKRPQTETLFDLAEELLKKWPKPDKSKTPRVYFAPYGQKTALVCMDEKEAASILPFFTFSLQRFADHHEAEEMNWKDAVLLFNDWVIRSRTLQEAVQNIATGLVHYLPFQRCAIFSYSNEERLGLGMYGYQMNNRAIQNIKLKITHVPLIKKNIEKLEAIGNELRRLQPLYIEQAEKHFPIEYVRRFKLESVIVAPIYVPSKGKLLGACILDRGEGQKFSVSRNTYIALMKSGQTAGELLYKLMNPHDSSHKTEPPVHLSRRETDVLRLMAEGMSTTEAADALHLSEYTVRDYVSSIMKKLNAKNRTEAATKAIRRGII